MGCHCPLTMNPDYFPFILSIFPPSRLRAGGSDEVGGRELSVLFIPTSQYQVKCFVPGMSEDILLNK